MKTKFIVDGNQTLQITNLKYGRHAWLKPQHVSELKSMWNLRKESKINNQTLLQIVAWVPNYPNKYKSLIPFSSVIPIHINLKQFKLFCWPTRVCIISKALMEEQCEEEEAEGK